MKSRRTLGVALAATLSAGLVAAQEPTPESEAPPVAPRAASPAELTESMPSRVLAQEPMIGAIPLSLSEAIAIALKSNLSVEILRFEPIIASERAIQAWGAYDPEAFADFGYDSSDQPIASALQEGNPSTPDVVDQLKNKNTGGDGGLLGVVPWLNATYEISLQGNKNTSNSSIQGLSPQYTSTFSISANIPLLRDLIWNSSWTNIKTAKIQDSISQQNFREIVMETVRIVELAYWELIARKSLLRVAQKSLETALETLEQTQTEYEVGVKSNVEVVEADATVAEREFDLIVAENNYENSMDNLIDVVFGPRLTPDTAVLIEPITDPEADIGLEVDVSKAVAVAFEKRPDIAIARETINREQIELKFAKNQRLPRFDVALGWGNTGLAGRDSQIPSFFPPPDTRAIGPDFGDTFNDFFTDRASEQFSVRGLVSIPIPNTSARKEVTISELEVRRSKTQMRRVEQQIIVDVRRAARDLEASQRGIVAARRRSASSAEQLRAERVKLQYGESTPFEVNLRQRDLIQAESQEISALQAYRNSIVTLDREQGTILDTHNISIDAVAELR